MENIKLYINASIDDVKIYLDKLIDFLNERNPNFEGFVNKINKNNQKNNYWSVIYYKLNIYSNLLVNNKLKINKISYELNIIIFLIFGITKTTNNSSNEFININLELYKDSIFSNEIVNFRNCLTIILIQYYILSEKQIIENMNDEKKDNIFNSIIKIIKCPYIKKSIHVIKSLIRKENHSKIDLFIPVLFYFIYEKYKSYFSSFIISDNCDIKLEYKNLLISEYTSSFTYNEIGSTNFNSKIFEIKLSYTLLGTNPKDKKINKFLETIKEKKLREELLSVFEKYYYENYVKKENLEKNDKSKKFINVLNEVQSIKKNIKELRNNLDELKDMHNNYMDDIFRVLNIINK